MREKVNNIRPLLCYKGIINRHSDRCLSALTDYCSFFFFSFYRMSSCKGLTNRTILFYFLTSSGRSSRLALCGPIVCVFSFHQITLFIFPPPPLLSRQSYRASYEILLTGILFCTASCFHCVTKAALRRRQLAVIRINVISSLYLRWALSIIYKRIMDPLIRD